MPSKPTPAPRPDLAAPPPATAGPGPAAPLATVALRHPGTWPLAFGPYVTGGVIHHVDPDTAARLLARGFERVPGKDEGRGMKDEPLPHPSTLIPHPSSLIPSSAAAPADPAPPAPED